MFPPKLPGTVSRHCILECCLCGGGRCGGETQGAPLLPRQRLEAWRSQCAQAPARLLPSDQLWDLVLQAPWEVTRQIWLPFTHVPAPQPGILRPSQGNEGK